MIRIVLVITVAHRKWKAQVSGKMPKYKVIGKTHSFNNSNTKAVIMITRWRHLRKMQRQPLQARSCRLPCVTRLTIRARAHLCEKILRKLPQPRLLKLLHKLPLPILIVSKSQLPRIERPRRRLSNLSISPICRLPTKGQDERLYAHLCSIKKVTNFWPGGLES